MILLVIDTQKGITDERLFEFEKFKDYLLFYQNLSSIATYSLCLPTYL